MSINVASIPYFRLLASISVGGGGVVVGLGPLFGEGRGWGLGGGCRDWRSDLVNKRAENNSLEFNVFTIGDKIITHRFFCSGN